MNARTTLVLLFVTAILGGFIWFVERKADDTEERIAYARRALRIAPERVARIQLLSPAMNMQLVRQGDGWHITSPIQAAADDGHIDRLLMSLVLLPRSQIITAAQLQRGHQKPSDYGMDQPRWKIVLGDRDSEMTLLMGRNAPAGDSLYLQMSDQRDIIVAPTNILSAMPANVADFRNRQLLPGTPDDIGRVELRSRAGFVQATRSANGEWVLTKPVSARADSTVIRDALRQLFSSHIVDFEAASKVGASLYGLDEPAIQCSLLSRDGAVEQTVLLGKTVESRSNLVYATKQGEDEIYTVDRALLAGLALSPEDVRDRRLVPLPIDRITGMKITSGDQGVELAVSNGEWMIKSPRASRADERKIRLALTEWVGTRVIRYLDPPGTNLAALGFVPPAQTISFITDAAAGRDSDISTGLEYQVSSIALTAGTHAVRMQGEDALLQVGDTTLAAIPFQPLYYRDTKILSVETGTVRSLTFEDGAHTNEIRIDASNEPPAAVGGALQMLQSLRARELVTEDTRNAEQYGLQPPSSKLTIGLAGTGSISRIIFLGKPARGGGRYATVQGQDLIFTLDGRDIDALWKPSSPASPHE